jgi:hypothetical protein
MAVEEGWDGGGTSVLAERAASEGPRSTRALEVTPFHPATSWGRSGVGKVTRALEPNPTISQ